MNNEMKDYYKILGITPDASLENIRKARERELGQNWSNPMGRVEIERAYSILSNPESRKEYDEMLKQALSEAELAKRNARTNSEFEQVNRDFDFYVDTDQLEQEQIIASEENIVHQAEETEVEEVQAGETEAEEVQIEETEVEEVQAEETEAEEVQTEETEEKKENQMEDIYSSSDHKIHSLLEEPEEAKEEIKEKTVTSEETKETPVASEETKEVEEIKEEQEEYIIPIQQKDRENTGKKELTKLQKGLIIGGSVAILGLPGLLVASLALKKLTGKSLKLHKNKHKKISDIKTQEAKLIEEYNKILEEQINTLLAQPHNNYNLQISKIRYENQIELLKKRIELKLNENVKRGSYLKYKVECVALKNQLERAVERLKKINSKIKEYGENQKPKNRILNFTNENLYEVDAELKQAEEEKRFSIKKLNIKKENWLKRRDFAARRLKTTRNFVGKIQDGAIKAFDCARSVKGVFLPSEELNYLKQEFVDQEQGKTR